MPVSVTIRNIPEKTRDELAARAKLAGRSLQEHLRAQLIELAARPDVATLMAQVRERKKRTGSRGAPDKIVAALEAERR
jgi:plasmid stability protein